MAVTMVEPQQTDFVCPGQQRPISRAVHLGRLAAFYPLCRQCPHRNDTGTLSPRQVEQLTAVHGSPSFNSPLQEEGAGGVYRNEFTPAIARDIAAAFARTVLDRVTSAESVPGPSVVLAGDGRGITAETTAAVDEGLRSTGCDVVDIGPATAACLAFTVHRLAADGGVLVGNPGDQPHIVGLQFWDSTAQPLSKGGSLDTVIERHRFGSVPRASRCGKLQRLQAEESYLLAMSKYYHALRPLRFIVDSASRSAIGYLQRLVATVACEIVPSRVRRNELSGQVRTDAVHFAVCIDGDGETCSVLDERGSPVSAGQILLLLAEDLCSAEQAEPIAVIVEPGTPRSVVEQLERRGMRATIGDDHREAMSRAMVEHGATLGGGPSGRFWHADTGVPLPDAVMTITRLLRILSRSDHPLSVVLDREGTIV